MLSELKNVSQEAGAPGKRRWFADEEMDLIVWYAADGGVEGFQLCYDKQGAEHAFTWKRGGRLRHARVDQGEGDPAKNKTPILLPDGAVGLERVLKAFAGRGKELEPELAALVLEKIRSFR